MFREMKNKKHTKKHNRDTCKNSHPFQGGTNGDYTKG